jgi:hypothetical protein
MRRTISVILVSLALFVPGLSIKASASPATYLVGAAQRSIAPTQQMIDDGAIFLGGAGSQRKMIEVADPGLSVRAVAIGSSSDPGDIIVFAVIETAGYFVAYKQGPYGIVHIRRAASAATGVPVDQLIVTSNHSHSGPDTIGIWGPQPPAEYLELIDRESVKAIEEAVADIRPAHISAGEAFAPELVSNDYADIPGNETSDPMLRVLQATDAGDGSAIVTLVDLSAHPILWISGDFGHGDWPAEIGNAVAERFGGIGIGVIGSVGRMAPDRAEASSVCGGQCKLRYFARQQMLPRVLDALAVAQPIGGTPSVDSRSYLVIDPVLNPIPVALFYLPDSGQLSIARRALTPWLSGNILGSVAFSARVGDIAFSGGPGEMFPSMTAEIAAMIPARIHFPVGLAGDMLGYIVHPLPDAYPEVLRRVGFDEQSPGDPTGWNAGGGDDKFIFNISPTFGERLVCAMLRGHGEILGAGLAYWDAKPLCSAFASDLAFASGDDTRQPEL